MKRFLRLRWLIIGLFLAFIWPPESIAQENYQIKSINAFLHYHRSGTFGKTDYIADPEPLWNTIIGEGSAYGASSTTIVLVEVSGPGFSAGIKGNVELRANTPKRTMLKQSIPLSTFFSESGNITVPFLVYGTGCEKLHLVATVMTDKNKKHSRTADVDFRCGE